MNNLLLVKKGAIIRNFEKNSHLDNLFLVTKSNFYGVGSEIISIANKFVKGYVFNSLSDYLFVKHQITDKKIILLYPNLSNKTIKELKENKDLFYVVMNTDQEQFVKQNDLFNKSYIRIDPFLGNHGFSIDYLNKEHVNKYHGVLLHVNENLSDHEFKIVQDIMNICEQKKLVLNIGGSCVLEDSRLNGCTELRAIMSFLLPRNATNVDETSIVLTTQVLQKQIITKPISIGYKSNRVVIEKGTIITISLGYGEFHLLRNLYQNKVKINILGNEYYIPCEPCMNTSWLYSPNKIYDISSRLTILSTKDFYRISSILDIDIDEILTAFKGIEVRIV